MDKPRCTVDIIVTDEAGQVLLIERRTPPYGWALPGGFVDPGERLDAAARREAREETGIELEDLIQFATYSEPSRDPRGHTLSTVYLATAHGQAQAASDAAQIAWFPLDALPKMAFDHAQILQDYIHYCTTGERPRLP